MRWFILNVFMVSALSHLLVLSKIMIVLTNAHSFSAGTLLVCSSQSEDSDMLWTLSADSFPFQKQLMETQVRHIMSRYES